MAPASKLQSRTVIPAIPRMFETKKKVAEEARQEPPVAVTKGDAGDKTDSEPAETDTQAVESTDWASLAELDTEDKGRSGSMQQEGSAKAEAETGAHITHAPRDGGFVSKGNGKHLNSDSPKPEVNGHKTNPFGTQSDGYYHAAPNAGWPHTVPPGFTQESFHRRAGPSINFGSFGGGHFESQGSSPSLPPSATSTHFTQPTPMSDTHSHASRGGHNTNGPPPGLRPLPAHSRNQSGFLDPRPQDFSGFLVNATASFDERNKADLLKSVEQDLFAPGPEALDLTVGTADGKDRFRIWRAVARRSVVLLRLLDFDASQNAPAQLHSHSAFVSLESVRAVLQSVYGMPLVSAEFLDGRQTLHFKRPLEFIATGYLLGAGHVIDYGADLALKMLRWESLAANFQFCTEEKIQDYGSGKGLELLDLPLLVPFGRPHHVEILAQSLDCIIREINGDEAFRFDDQATYFSELGGGFHAVPASVQLPGYGTNTNPTNGPSQIQFGSRGSFYRHKHQTISSILLSLPVAVLQHVLSHVFSLNLVKDVVSERERRRQHALKINKAGVLLHHAHYKESILPTPEFNGLRLISVRT